jgi:hypothetical protein
MKHLIQRKQLCIILTLICCTNILWAQDIITLKNGNEIQAKVLEVGTHDIKYKKFENQEGPTYTTLKAEIFMIKYQNGDKDVFTSKPIPEADNSMSNHLLYAQYQVSKNGNVLKRNAVKTIISSNQAALKLYTKGCKQYDAGFALSIIGAGGVGAGLSLLIIGLRDDQINMLMGGVWSLASGLVFMLPGVLVLESGSKKMRTAINMYNNNVTACTLNFGIINTGGIRLVLKF